MVLGLTGHIASGKSTVAKALSRLGALVVDADLVAREVVKKGSPLLAEVVGRFGDDMLMADGSLNRAALGHIVFSDPEALTALNNIMHPVIRRVACQRLEQARKASAAPLIVYDAALLFEVGADALVDKVLLVVVDEEVQLQRLMARNGFDQTEALQRINAQQGLSEKKQKADYIIDNSGTEAELVAKVAELWPQLIKQSHLSETPDSV